MKALIIEQPGTIDGFKINEEVVVPKPGFGEVRIQVKAVGLNPSDYQTIEFLDKVAPNQTTILGLDVAGIIDQIGEGVTDFKKGDRVFYLRELNNKSGGFAEYSITKAHHLVKLPNNITFEIAASIPGAGFTAFKAIEQNYDLFKVKQS